MNLAAAILVAWACLNVALYMDITCSYKPDPAVLAKLNARVADGLDPGAALDELDAAKAREPPLRAMCRKTAPFIGWPAGLALLVLVAVATWQFAMAQKIF